MFVCEAYTSLLALGLHDHEGCVEVELLTRTMVGAVRTQCHVADDLIESGLTPESVLRAKMRSLRRKMRLWYELL